MHCSCCGMCKGKTEEQPNKLNKLTQDYLGIYNNEIEEDKNKNLPRCFYISLNDIYIFIKDKVKQKHKTE